MLDDSAWVRGSDVWVIQCSRAVRGDGGWCDRADAAAGQSVRDFSGGDGFASERAVLSSRLADAREKVYREFRCCRAGIFGILRDFRTVSAGLSADRGNAVSGVDRRGGFRRGRRRAVCPGRKCAERGRCAGAQFIEAHRCGNSVGVSDQRPDGSRALADVYSAEPDSLFPADGRSVRADHRVDAENSGKIRKKRR